MYLKENTSNGTRDTDEKAQCSKSKVPLFINRTQPNSNRFYYMRGVCEVRIFKKNPSMESRYI